MRMVSQARARNRRARRLAFAVATVVVAVTGAAGLVFAGPPAVADEADEAVADEITASRGDRTGGLAILASAAVDRAGASAQRLAVASTPAPPPRVHCPVPASQFVDSWGFARSGGRRHKGVDMMAAHGSPVYAPVAGVVRASNSSLGGIGFYLDDPAGNEYFGSHLATLDAVGWVEAGTQIGTVGSTGNAGTPHLHFEIAPGGGASVNPYPYALAWCLQDPDDAWSEAPIP